MNHLYPKPSSELLQLLYALFEDTIDGIILHDEAGVIQAINPAAATLFGYERAALLGKKVYTLLSEPSLSSYDTLITTYLADRDVVALGGGRTIIGVRKDEDTFPFSLSVSVVGHAEHPIFAVVIHDLSDLEASHVRLANSKARYQAVLQHAVDGIIIIDKKGCITEVNPAVSRLFGYEEKEMIGQNISMLMPAPESDEHDDYIRRYQQGGKAKIIGTGREVQGKKKNGELFPFNLGVSELEVDGEMFYTGVIHDLSQQKESERRIRQLNEKLEQKVSHRTEELAEVVNRLLATNTRLKTEIKERQEIQRKLQKNKKELEKLLSKEKELGELKSRFVSMASHEFKTPLSTILSSASLIERYTLEAQQKNRMKHIQRIKASVQHLDNLLNDFLSVGKLDEGRVAYRPESVEWTGFMEEILDAMQVILKKDQRIQSEKEGDWDRVVTDRNLLKNILFNLLSNASKYSEEGQPIILTAQQTAHTLIISIQDFGMGISAEDQTQLFDRFYRGKNVDNIKGTGLGLNIVKKYLEILNGSISLQSQVGEGSTFTIEIALEGAGK